MEVVTINYHAALLNTVNLRVGKRKHTQLKGREKGTYCGVYDFDKLNAIKSKKSIALRIQ